MTTRNGLNILFPLTLLSLLQSVAALGDYKYCCNIAKCHNITTACRGEPKLVDGLTCAQNCLAGFECTPYISLADKDYNCFEPYLNGTASAPARLICGQTFQEGLDAAPDIYVNYTFCSTECSGWRMSRWGKPSEWAASLLQYILPAVIFSMTIPRRRKIEVPDGLFNFDLERMDSLLWTPLSIIFSIIIATVDTFIWVFVIFVGAGPMLVGGIHEAVLDRRIIMHLNDTHQEAPYNNQNAITLSKDQKAELLLVVVSGNLDRKTETSPETELKRAVGIDFFPGQGNKQSSETLIRLFNIMASQYSFGSIVGAPVLFYVGSFIYGVSGLSTNQGDNDTSHALAFGMWWMVIVHVAIVGGCLLASNNPSSVTAIAAETIADDDGALVLGPETNSFDWLRYLTTTAIYKTPFQPVPMWDRGCNKKFWIEGTRALTGQPRNAQHWFHDKIKITGAGYFAIGLFSFVLVIIPATLAFIVSYFTPKVCLSCRSLTFTVYTCSQTILIIVATMRSYYSSVDADNIGNVRAEFITDLGRFWNNGSTWSHWLKAGGYIFACICTVFAIAGAILTGFVSTLLQIIGTFRNCKCNISVTSWRNPAEDTFNVASDTQLARENSQKFWIPTGTGAIVFMASVCWLGWWYQRYLRRRFVQRLEGLS